MEMAITVNIELIIIFGYLLCVFILGIWAGKNISDLKDFAIAGKSFGALVIFATLSASFIGGGFSMGNAEKVYLFGIANIFALWGFSFKEIFVAWAIAPKIGNYPGAISVGDIIGIHYGKSAKVFTGIFGVILCSGILGAQVGAMGYIFNVFLGIDKIWGILLGCSIVITYSTVGGMKAVVWTDIVQFIILSIGLPLTLIYGIINAGGIENIISSIPDSHLALPVESLALIGFISLFFTFVLGETLVPPYLQRLLVGKDVKSVTRGTFLSGIFSIPFFAVTGLIGLVALVMNPYLDPNLAMPYVIRNSLSPVLQGIVISGVISIIMSSADSFLNSSAISFVHDVLKPIKRKPISELSELKYARTATLLTGILAVIFALSIDSVLDILIYSYNFWAPTVLVPLVAAVLGFKVNKNQFKAGAVVGIAAVIIWRVVFQNPFGIEGLVVGFFANLSAFIIAGKKNSSQRPGRRESTSD